MKARINRFIALVLWAGCALGAGAPDADEFAAVIPGYVMHFPRDYGAHSTFRTEWWYVTGWLHTPDGEDLGFQVTFFRSRLPDHSFGANPSAFAAQQILAAHVAISDPVHGHLWLDQRTARAVFGLAGFTGDDTRVWIDQWKLERSASGYSARVDAHDFSLRLHMVERQAPLLNGIRGFSQKASTPSAASYYYSVPHMAVTGNILRAHHWTAVTGEAWLDHEWSSAYLVENAVGWDWAGINLTDGGSIMAFDIRAQNGDSLWAGATYRSSSGVITNWGPGEVRFQARREWRSAATGITYPVAMDLMAGDRHLRLEPLMSDQESDTRLSTGSVYWEGAVTADEHQQRIGRGYLELTGFGAPLKLH